MIENVVTNVKLSISYEKGSYSNSKVNMNATDDKILMFGKAVQSLQKNTPKKYVKTVTSQLFEI